MNRFLEKLNEIKELHDVPHRRAIQLTNREAFENSIESLNLNKWQTLGLNVSPFCANTYFDAPVQTNNFIVDGTCAVGKSSLGDLIKVNVNMHNIAINTHNSNALGYLFTSIETLMGQEKKIFDRSPYNNYVWGFMWQVLANNFIGSGGGEETFNEDLCKKYARMIAIQIPEECITLAKSILIVDTNEDEAIFRLRNRNQGHDQQRSYWRYYIRTQNYFYAILAATYPQHFHLVDLADFKSQTEMQTYVRNFIQVGFDRIKLGRKEFTFADIQKPNKRILMDEDAERCRPIQTVFFTDGAKKIVKNMKIKQNALKRKASDPNPM